jgi:hypothetical protein
MPLTVPELPADCAKSAPGKTTREQTRRKIKATPRGNVSIWKDLQKYVVYDPEKIPLRQRSGIRAEAD